MKIFIWIDYVNLWNIINCRLRQAAKDAAPTFGDDESSDEEIEESAEIKGFYF